LYPFYYWYYGTRVAYLLGGDIWRVWRQNVCGLLVRHQDADGSWRLNHSEHRSGKTYITALGALMLEIGAGYPPFYLRKDAAPKRAPVRVPEEIAVSLLNPIAGAVVVGSTEIVAQPKGSANVVVKALRFFVNDQVIGTATAEPWTCVWDFGPQARSHKIKVEVESATGKKATAEVKTRQPADQVQVKIHRPSSKVVAGEEVSILFLRVTPTPLLLKP
jgi:hypothetical protein